MINIDNEYLLIVNDEIFRVYAPNKKKALVVFQSACVIYANTSNEDFKNYWNNLNKAIDNGNYKILQNNDFIGVRKI